MNPANSQRLLQHIRRRRVSVTRLLDLLLLVAAASVAGLVERRGGQAV